VVEKWREGEEKMAGSRDSSQPPASASLSQRASARGSSRQINVTRGFMKREKRTE
jgi:hypothetical protein